MTLMQEILFGLVIAALAAGIAVLADKLTGIDMVYILGLVLLAGCIAIIVSGLLG